MKDVTDIFLINADGVLEVNKIEARNIPEFKEILIRDKGGKVDGDYDGRRKFFAFRELMFIYLTAHPASIYRDLPDKIREEKARKDCNLPDTWKVDKLIEDAKAKFIELIDMSALYHSYINANKGVYALGEDIKFFNILRDKMRSSIKAKVLQLDNVALDADKQALEGEIDHLTVRLLDLGNKINTISNNLPTAFDTVETLKQKLLKESNSGAGVYGGGTIHSREK